MKFAGKKIVDGISMATTITSDPVLLDQLLGYAVQAVYSGSPSGVMTLEASCDDVKLITDVVNWTPIDDSEHNISASGNFMYNVEWAFYKYFRVVYDPLSGSGNLDVTFSAKG